MIFVTGDIHGSHGIRRLTSRSFPEGSSLNKQDYIIILGDFGLVWDNSNEEKYWLRWLANKHWTTLWLDGNHENFDLLYNYPVERWHGGNVHIINDSVIHLMRGQVFTIGELKFFTMGGGTSIDKAYRIWGKTWWTGEMPSDKEFNNALDNLDLNHWKVDYVLTHTVSIPIMNKMDYLKENSYLNHFLDKLQDRLEYRHWYFGHFHLDERIDGKHTAIYNHILKIT